MVRGLGYSMYSTISQHSRRPPALELVRLATMRNWTVLLQYSWKGFKLELFHQFHYGTIHWHCNESSCWTSILIFRCVLRALYSSHFAPILVHVDQASLPCSPSCKVVFDSWVDVSSVEPQQWWFLTWLSCHFPFIGILLFAFNFQFILGAIRTFMLHLSTDVAYTCFVPRLHMLYCSPAVAI